MSEKEHKERDEEKPQDAGEPRSPGAAVSATNTPAGDSLHDRAEPGEGELPRRADMGPRDHGPRRDDKAAEERKGSKP